MRVTAALPVLYLSYHFLVTSLRELTGVQDNICRCVCTAAPPVVVAPPVAVASPMAVNVMPDGTHVDDLGLD